MDRERKRCNYYVKINNINKLYFPMKLTIEAEVLRESYDFFMKKRPKRPFRTVRCFHEFSWKRGRFGHFVRFRTKFPWISMKKDRNSSFRSFVRIFHEFLWKRDRNSSFRSFVRIFHEFSWKKGRFGHFVRFRTKFSWIFMKRERNSSFRSFVRIFHELLW